MIRRTPGRRGSHMSVELERAFEVYFEEIERCIHMKCYWALAHILVVLPDVCAALETENWETPDRGYIDWCNLYFSSKMSGQDRYSMRCVLLHQGRTVMGHRLIKSVSLVWPADTGDIPHEVTYDFGEGRTNIPVDVTRMAEDTKQAVRRWFADLQKPENASRMSNVQRHLPWLARKGRKAISGATGITITIPTVSSTGGYGK